MKKVSVLLSIIVLISVGYWAFHEFVKKQKAVFDLLSTIPDDAVMIIEIADGGTEASLFYQRSMLWNDFEGTPFAKDASPFFQILDSLNEEHQIIISLHPGGDINQNLISISDPSGHIKAMLSKYGAKKEEGENPQFLKLAGVDYLFDMEDKFIRVSKNRELLIHAKKETELDHSILNDSSFVKIRPYLEKINSIKIFINLERFSESMNRAIMEDIFDFPDNLKGWIASDLYDKANTIVSSGFIEFNPKEEHFFSAYEGQIAQGLQYFDILPANTAILTASGQSNPKNFLNKLNAANSDTICTKYFSSWMGNAFGNAILNGDRKIEELRFSFFEIRDVETFLEKTQVFKDANVAEMDYRTYQINKLDSTFSFSCFSDGYRQIHSPYYTLIKDYVVFSSNEETLKEIIKRFLNDNTLSKQESFSNLRDELSDETNYLFYISPAMAGSFLEKEIPDSLKKYWLPDENKINTLQAMVVQVSAYKPGKMYLHSVLRHQVVNFQEKDNSLWEMSVNAPIKGQIHLVRNHYSQHLEIAVQDTDNVLYLINNKGELLWKKDLKEEIIGDIDQIDIYKNGKLQMLFNTSGKLYCLDREGNNLEKFPVSLKSKTQLQHTLLDYDSNKDYRIIISFPDGDLELYDAKGYPVKGWKFDKVRSSISETAQHIRIDRKDYIYTSTSNGTILLLDRKGKSRYKAKENIADKIGNAFIYTAKSISGSGIYYIDSLGAIVNVTFGGQKEYLPIKGKKGDRLLMARINDDNTREFILYNSSSIRIYDLKGEKLFDEISVNELEDAPNKYRFEKKNWIGYTDNKTKEAYLRDVKGRIRSDAPYSGSGSFRIDDINQDGIMELIIRGEQGQLIVYSLTKQN